MEEYRRQTGGEGELRKERRKKWGILSRRQTIGGLWGEMMKKRERKEEKITVKKTVVGDGDDEDEREKMKKEGEYCQEDRQWGEEERKKKGEKSVCVCVGGWGGGWGGEILSRRQAKEKAFSLRCLCLCFFGLAVCDSLLGSAWRCCL